MVELLLVEGNAAALLGEKITGTDVPAANEFEEEPRNELELKAGKEKVEVPNNPLDDVAA